jgi:GDPmannose 4,6-dehydratase
VNYRESYGLFATNGILFNHESPLRGKDFVTRKITDGVAQIKLGKLDKIKLGNLDAKRDWGYAVEFVEAMWAILQQDTAGDFVIGTGVCSSIREFLTLAFAYVGIEDWTPYVEIDPRFNRPAEIGNLCGDSSKAQRLLGWKPKTSLQDLVKIMMDADIDRHKS